MDKIAIVKRNFGVIKDIEKAIEDYENGRAIPDNLEVRNDHGYIRISAKEDPVTFAYFNAKTHKFEFATHDKYRVCDTKEGFSNFAKQYEKVARDVIRREGEGR